MTASVQDFQIAALAAGFTLGFGILTVWEAIKQTRRNRNPLKSVYIYMIWGEVAANIIIAIIGWLFLNDRLGPSLPVLFFILFFWVFEIQLLMQIIINRIALIAEHRSTVTKLKWGTVALITTINIAVFVIWIPSHTVPPVSETFVRINGVWDKISKVLILIVDAGLNWYFLKTVKQRLVQQHGLIKYQPLVGFNAKLMVLSVAMDALLIGLMFLKNQIVYIQIHPVVYIVKLNIEMTMASLVVRLAQGRPENDMYLEDKLQSSSNKATHLRSDLRSGLRSGNYGQQATHIQSAMIPKLKLKDALDDDDSAGSMRGIHCQTDYNVTVDPVDSHNDMSSYKRSWIPEPPRSTFDDDAPLQK